MADVQFIDHTDEVDAALQDAIEAALEAMGQQAVSYAKSNITAAGRVDTGAMRNSLSHAVATDENAVYVGTNNEYAPFHELGTGIYLEGGGGRQTPWAYQDAKGEWHRTRGLRPIHFLKNAVQDHAGDLEQIAAQTIGDRMK